MIKSTEQSAILHDAYFNKPPSLIRLFLVRLALLCGLSASAIASIVDLYLFEGELWKIYGAAAFGAGIIYILASVLPAVIVYLCSLGGFVLLGLNDTIREKLSFFWDYFMLRLNGRLLKTEELTIHGLDDLKNGVYTAEISEGCMLGFILLGIFMGLLLVMSSRTRFRPFRAMLIFAVFAAPAFAAEIAGYHTSIAFFAAFYFAFYAVRMAYEQDGVFVFEKIKIAGDALKRNERSYRRRMFFAVFGKKFNSDIPRYFKYNANSIIALIATGAIMLTAAHLIPDGTTFDYEEVFTGIQDAGFKAAEKLENAFDFNFGTSASKSRNEYFSYSQYGDNSGGIGISEPSDSDRPVLDVVLEKNDIPVYLRGDVGVNFTGTGWTALRDEYETASGWDKIKDFYFETQYQIARQKMVRTGYDPDEFLPLQKVSVTYRQKTNVIFQALAPYELNYRESDFLDSYGDTVYRVKKGSGYLNTYETLALTPNMDYSQLYAFFNASPSFSWYMGEWNVPGGLSNQQYLQYIVDYEEYIKGLYRTNSYENIDRLINELTSGGYFFGIGENTARLKTAEGVCRYFKENFTYSLTVDNGSDDVVLDNFLYNTKEGHCALFATSAVLALREMGVPARYVTGYVVSGEGNYTSEGYLHTLREKDLHAWIEVYFDGIGWLPFDPTAAVDGFMPAETEHTRATMTFTSPEEVGSDGFASDTTVVADPVIEGEEQAESISTDESTTLPPEISEGEEIVSPADPEPPVVQKKDNKLIPLIVTILIVLLAAGAAVLAVYMLIKRVNEAEKKTMNGFRKKNSNRAVSEMYQLVMIILAKEGLEPGCEMMVDFAQRVDSSIFLKGTNVFMVDIMPVFVKCEFGNAEISPVTEEERTSVYKFTSVVYRKYMENMGSFKRFITKISLFL